MKQIDINDFTGLNKEANDFTNWNNANETIPNNSRYVLVTNGDYWFPAYYNHVINDWETSFKFNKYAEVTVITHWTDIYCLKSHMDYLPEYHESDNFGSIRVN